MIDFSLTEEQEMLQKTARDFARDVMRPASAHHDETGEYPHKILDQAWELGLMNSHIPEEYGGLGLGVLDGCIIAEETAWGCTGIGTAMDANTLAQGPLIVANNKLVNDKFLRPMNEERQMAAYCVTEPSAGSDVKGIKTTARRVGDEYVINGSKMWITNGSVATWYFVLAYTNKDAGHGGMSAFVVPADTPGITVGRKEQNMGQRASDTRSITFEDVTIPAEYRLGEEGHGWKLAMAAFDHSRPVVAASAVGLARAAMEHSIDYALERKTFGRSIAKYQGVSFKLADMAKDIQAARLLVWLSGWQIDRGKRNTLEAAYAKCFAADTAMKTAVEAVQVFGGYGFNKEYPVEKLMRDAKIFQIYEGTCEIQRLIIAREILSRR